MNAPENLLYAKSHEWVKIEGDIARIGISAFAQEQLGDITFVELPEPGDTITAGEEMGSIESVKAASELYAPVSGKIIEINEALEDAPEKVNESPFAEGWMVTVKLSGPPENLLSPAEYTTLMENEAH